AKVDGVVRASMPLAYNGTIIDDFELTFEAGRVVKATAGTGQKALDNILDTDEGSRRLGEVALVPASSPIAKTGLLFLETLFDENAACHIALGKAYGMTVRGSDEMTPEQRAEVGMNESLSHVDFMIGSSEMDVDGERADGERVPLMRAGEWVHGVPVGAKSVRPRTAGGRTGGRRTAPPATPCRRWATRCACCANVSGTPSSAGPRRTSSSRSWAAATRWCSCRPVVGSRFATRSLRCCAPASRSWCRPSSR